MIKKVGVKKSSKFDNFSSRFSKPNSQNVCILGVPQTSNTFVDIWEFKSYDNKSHDKSNSGATKV